MKKLLLFIVLTTNIAAAQTFNNYDFDTQNSDQLVNIMEYETGYLLTGYITDSAFTAAHGFYGAPVLVKLSKSGLPLDTIITSNYGHTELAQTTAYYGGYFYTFGTTNPQSDSIQLVVTKHDTSFNFIEKKVYPQLNAVYYMHIHKYHNGSDSTMFFYGSHYAQNKGGYYHSFIFKYNFITMAMSKFDYIPKNFLAHNILISNNEDRYIFVGYDHSTPMPPYESEVLVYDSSFNLLSCDTLLVQGITYNYFHSNMYIKKYRDSLYLALGESARAMPINNPTHYIMPMEMQILDSNFQLQSDKYWYYDSLTHVDLSNENGIISNSNNEYYLGGTVYGDVFFPSDGILIVKLDSNLNTIWEKHIECTEKTMRLMNMLPTDDGGLLILYQEQASLIGAQLVNSKLVKIGLNGEVTSIFEFTIPIPQITIELFPNPASTYIEINLKTQNQDNINLSILDINGKVILQKHVNSPKTKLDISTLSNGVYIIEGVTSKGNRFSAKFIKE